MKAESEAERSYDLLQKKSTVCWRRRKRQGKRNMIITRERGLKDCRRAPHQPSFLHTTSLPCICYSCCTIALCDLQIFCSKSTGCRLLEYKQTFFGVVVLVFLRLFQPECATLALFRFVSTSFTLTTMAVGNTSEGFASVLSFALGRFERLKTVLMGTNTPHTFSPGLVWQKQARRFSQFELKVGELGFPIH